MTTRAERQRKRPATNVLAAVCRTHWAIAPEALQNILSIVQRQNLDPKAIEMERGEPLRNTWTVTVRDGIATIPVRGPMVRYADIFTRISGATSYEDIATDFKSALDDPRIKAIVFDIDSPGGEVNGCFELARQIHASRGTKPIVAYVSNWACSGAYELAAACDEIVMFEAAMLGSIGIIACYIDDKKMMNELGLKEIVLVSSNAPNKHVDPAEREGAAAIVEILDGLEAVFEKDIATFLGISVDKVRSDFGQGGVFVGQEVIDRGMADRLGSYEALLAELLERETTASGAFKVIARAVPTATDSTGENSMKATLQTPPAAGATVAGAPPKTRATTGSEGGESEEELDEQGNPKSKKKAEGEQEEPKDKEKESESAEDEDEEKKDGESDKEYGARMRSIGARAEAKRVTDIRALGKPGEEKTIQACIDDPSCTVEMAAKRLREAETQAGKDRLAALRQDDAGAHATNAAPPAQDQTPQAAAKSAVKAFYELTQPSKGR